ncbi:MAG: DoxX family protein, partial [Propionibacteriaceae bacterium]
MSSSYTPPTRPDGYSTPSGSNGTTTTSGSYGSTGSTGSTGRSSTDVVDPDVKPVKPRSRARADLGRLVLRLALAAIMLAHGYQKLFLQGGGSFTATQSGFSQMGVPLPQVAGIVII